jgi:hypothetical protein
MEAVHSSETQVNFYHTKRCHRRHNFNINKANLFAIHRPHSIQFIAVVMATADTETARNNKDDAGQMTCGHSGEPTIEKQMFSTYVVSPYVSPCLMSGGDLIKVRGFLAVHRKHNFTHDTGQQMTTEYQQPEGLRCRRYAKLNRPICSAEPSPHDEYPFSVRDTASLYL